MADAIERLYRLSVDATQASAQLQKLKSTADLSTQAFDKFSDGLKDIGKTFAAGFAVDVVIEKFRATVDAMDDIVKASQRVGVAADNLQTLRYAAQASGASAEALDKGLEHLGTNLQDVATGTTDAAKALRAFGVTDADSTAQAFAKIADGLAKIPDGAQKTATAIAIFGKAGAELIPTLNAGREGLGEFAKEARALGLVMSTEALKAAEHFNDQLDMLGNLGKASAESFLTGLLPALQAITKELIDARKGGEGFTSWGDAFGEDAVRIAMGVQLIAGYLKGMGLAWDAMQASISHPFAAKEILEKAHADIKAQFDKTIASLHDLKSNWESAREAINHPFVGPPEPPGLHNIVIATDKLTAAQQHAADMMKVYSAAAQANATEDERAAKAADDRAKSTKAVNDALHASEAGQRDATQAAQDAFETEQKRLALLDGYVKLLETGDDWQKQFAASQILILDPAKKQTEQLKENSAALKVLSDGFDGFVNALSTGSVTAAQAFKGMVESITADLLKLLANQALAQLLGFFFGGDTSNPALAPREGRHAFGAAFDRGQVVPFALGGVFSSPTTFALRGRRMGLMAEAGPEAVMPLQRTGDGALGVRAIQAPLQVAIHNYADATVTARRDDAGNLQILIEQTKRAIAADIRRGGTDVSRAAEAAWSLSRGGAAPF